MAKPERVTIRSYNVGFGDCFVVIIHYTSGPDRHILIDFGSTRMPGKGNAARRSKKEIARDIVESAGGHLEMVVATHRHADHINGFSQSAGDIIAEAKPRIIVQPWTEDPEIATDAIEPSTMDDQGLYLNTMTSMDKIATYVKYITDMTKEAGSGKRSHRKHPWAVQGLTLDAVSQLNFLGETNIKNADAVKHLIAMAGAGRGFYVSHGDQRLLNLPELPGVSIEVVGPPTVAQWSKVRQQRGDDPDEFWMTQKAFWLSESGIAIESDPQGGQPSIFPDRPVLEPKDWPFAARWAIPSLRSLRGDQLYQIVRTLDTALNNTSVVMLIHIGNLSLLFPGDAQIESWLWPLNASDESPQWQKKLADIDFYKVGHHGSRNATPKTLFQLWEEEGLISEDATTRLTTVVSTRGNVHGHTWRDTEVPRRTLTKALEAGTNYHSTSSQRASDDFRHDTVLQIVG